MKAQLGSTLQAETLAFVLSRWKAIEGSGQRGDTVLGFKATALAVLPRARETSCKGIIIVQMEDDGL